MSEPYQNAESEEEVYTERRWQNELAEYIREQDAVRFVATYQEEGVMTLNKGLIVTMVDGKQYHITITGH